MISYFHILIAYLRWFSCNKWSRDPDWLYSKCLTFEAIAIIFFKNHNILINLKCYAHCLLNTIYLVPVYFLLYCEIDLHFLFSLPIQTYCLKYYNHLMRLILGRNNFPSCYLCFFLFFSFILKNNISR